MWNESCVANQNDRATISHFRLEPRKKPNLERVKRKKPLHDSHRTNLSDQRLAVSLPNMEHPISKENKRPIELEIEHMQEEEAPTVIEIIPQPPVARASVRPAHGSILGPV